jgi:hypothetical protein
VPNLNKRIWKLKAPLKIKIFLWYLRRGVVLTKDNLAKRNCHGSVKCCFCHKDETVKHLFFKCPLARTTWNLIQVATNLYPPCSISNMFNSWLRGLNKDLKQLVLLGAPAFCWAIWRHRNGIVFERKTTTNVLQVLHSATHWPRTWVVLQKPIFRESVMAICQRLEQVARMFFSRAHGGDLVFGLVTTKCLVFCLGLGCVHLARCRSRVLYQGSCIL